MRQPERWKVGTSYNVKNTAGLEEIKSAGLDCIELVLHSKDWNSQFQELSEQFTAIVQEANRLNLHIWSVHLPYGHDWDVSCPDDAKREAIIANQYKLLELAESWGVGRAVLHPSYEPIPIEDRRRRLSICRDGLQQLARRAGHLNIRIAVECLPRTCLGNTSDEILELIGSEDRLMVCCDVNHLLQETAVDFINKVGSRIITVHMSDYDGEDEKHWMPGEGIIDWKNVLRALAGHGYEGPFMFEVRNPSPEDLTACWRRLLALNP
ncbi:L-ribulose-5-phosphate 3-epimerase ulaE [Chlamydia abortus]|uniref:Sugar phosphate isomerase/epimerase family protein n=1 Tax=Paenibacillus residui TaxID=629724 RepID=A0ABW3D9Z4_9BACL|nr:sugar phosphate isomerase/epimerase family protein [Paenibacillus sp. 32O-W]SHE10751.1 L-ribulose-5-phosphate 3-epimerase ulaE [Chlamydia abortus]